MKSYFVYIITNDGDSVFYTGVTNNLERRMQEHRKGMIDGFSKKIDLFRRKRRHIVGHSKRKAAEKLAQRMEIKFNKIDKP